MKKKLIKFKGEDGTQVEFNVYHNVEQAKNINWNKVTANAIELVDQINKLNPNNLPIEKAMKFSRKKHKNQTRDSGEPYYLHPIKVFQVVGMFTDDEDVLCAALLHDVIEDCKVKPEEIEKKWNKRVRDIVVELSKNYTDPKDINSKEAIMIKLADRLHNISDMKTWSYKKQEEYIKNTKRNFL